MPDDDENHLFFFFFPSFFLREEMAYDLRPRKYDKDYLPLVWYLLPRDVLLQVAEHAAEAALPRYRLRVRGSTDGRWHRRGRDGSGWR